MLVYPRLDLLFSLGKRLLTNLESQKINLCTCMFYWKTWDEIRIVSFSLKITELSWTNPFSDRYPKDLKEWSEHIWLHYRLLNIRLWSLRFRVHHIGLSLISLYVCKVSLVFVNRSDWSLNTENRDRTAFVSHNIICHSTNVQINTLKPLRDKEDFDIPFSTLSKDHIQALHQSAFVPFPRIKVKMCLIHDDDDILILCLLPKVGLNIHIRSIDPLF